MWHVSSRSGVATLRTAIHLLFTTYLLTRQGAALMSTFAPMVLGSAARRLDYQWRVVSR